MDTLKKQIMDANIVILNCPHCQGLIEVLKTEINCGIFRHHPDLSPHAPKVQCDAIDKQLGCGKPFQIILSPELMIQKIDYI